ncbi:hypothetical protein PLICRDRAFT_34497 [Plicaturopsis crispa FD-325 SS-3]|nr:hypothetical protein PLICRDRAFT_34497 [Plicaturopsis crispa FD-325 SS-3]
MRKSYTASLSASRLRLLQCPAPRRPLSPTLTSTMNFTALLLVAFAAMVTAMPVKDIDLRRNADIEHSERSPAAVEGAVIPINDIDHVFF